MAIKQYKPTTAGRRKSSVQSFADVTSTTPHKALIVSQKQIAGRGNKGHISVRHRGGGAKRHIRIIDCLSSQLRLGHATPPLTERPGRRELPGTHPSE